MIVNTRAMGSTTASAMVLTAVDLRPTAGRATGVVGSTAVDCSTGGEFVVTDGCVFVVVDVIGVIVSVRVEVVVSGLVVGGVVDSCVVLCDEGVVRTVVHVDEEDVVSFVAVAVVNSDVEVGAVNVVVGVVAV